MAFQIIDERRGCYGVYTNGQFIYDRVPSNLRRTWAWSSHLASGDYDYGFLWTGGKSLSEACPPSLKPRLELYEKKIKAHIKSYINAKVNVQDSCLFDLVPENHLKGFLETKNQICEYVFENIEKPANYTFLAQTYETIKELAQQKLKIDWELVDHLSLTDPKAMALADKFDPSGTFVIYNMFGSVTGRLTTTPESFPVLNLKAEHRGVLLPRNDWLVEMDYNGAEIRTLLSLVDKEQPEEDIHEWNIKNVYRDLVTREKAKKRFFSWLYNPNSEDYLTSRAYDREAVLTSYYRGGCVHTPFGRKIETDDFHALNYLLQSSSSDNCLHQVNIIHRFLRDKKSKLAFAVHDSIVIDLAHSERNLLPQIRELFADTKLGKFKVGVKIGKNMGKLKEFSW